MWNSVIQPQSDWMKNDELIFYLSGGMTMNRGWKIILLFLAVSVVLLLFSPVEQTLGGKIRLVYFHVTVSMAGLIAIYVAGGLGLAYLAGGNKSLGNWSAELGLWSVAVWFVGVILSIFAMQVVWGGLFWTEPLTVAALTVLVLGAGKEYLVRGGSVKLKAAANVGFALAVLLIRSNMTRVMHPVNPITASDSFAIKLFPTLMLLVALAAIFEFTRWRLKYK
jgi:hypothetical protein